MSVLVCSLVCCLCLVLPSGLSISVPAVAASAFGSSAEAVAAAAASFSPSAASASAASPPGLPPGMKYHVGYLTSYPLVTLKNRADTHPEPIKLLRLQKDVDETRQALREINKAVRVRFEHASVQNCGDLLNKGCKVLHYSGHVR